MKLFLFNLIGEAKDWIKSQHNQSLISWIDVESNFLQDYFHQPGMPELNMIFPLLDKDKRNYSMSHGKDFSYCS